MRYIFSISLALLVAACVPVPITVRATTDAEKASVSGGMTYFKDKHGLCYASVLSGSIGVRRTASIASVPCNKVGL